MAHWEIPMSKKPEKKTQKKTQKKTEYSQWGASCPDAKRNRVPGINIVLQDMLNPCELAQQLGVRLEELRARTIPNPNAKPPAPQMMNDFYKPKP
jgi:hypothetical protein